MVDKVLFSSDNTEWETPQHLWDSLDLEFEFDLDAAATDTNAKAATFYTKEFSGLEHPWYDKYNGIRNVWCNPPYGRKVGQWIEKAYKESQRGAIVVMLLPARTDTSWFHDLVLGRAEIRFLRGRLTFELDGEPVQTEDKKTGLMKPSPAPFPSMIAIFRPPHLNRF